MNNNDLLLANRYFDNELEPEEAAAFERRLESESHLKVYMEELKALDKSAGQLEVIRAPETGSLRGLRFFHRHRPSRALPFFAGAAVAAACILVGIFIGAGILQNITGAGFTESFRIVYYAPGAKSVSVLGDFNGWKGEIPLKPRGGGGYWMAELRLKPGEYRYILKIDGKKKAGDPLADYLVDDDFGSKNSVVRIGL